MRISDWSSDVCSSDLEPAAHIDAGAGPGADQHRGADGDQQQLLHLAALSDGGFGFILAHGSTLSVQAKRPRRSAAPALPSISAIGRSSCRERGCQYVSIQGCAGALKKQYGT